MAVVRNGPVFWDMRALPASCFMLVSCLDYSWTMRMEVTHSSETSFSFQRPTLLYNPEYRTLQDMTYCYNISMVVFINLSSGIYRQVTWHIFFFFHEVRLLASHTTPSLEGQNLTLRLAPTSLSVKQGSPYQELTCLPEDKIKVHEVGWSRWPRISRTFIVDAWL
jgi:hypothetical protein